MICEDFLKNVFCFLNFYPGTSKFVRHETQNDSTDHLLRTPLFSEWAVLIIFCASVSSSLPTSKSTCSLPGFFFK